MAVTVRSESMRELLVLPLYFLATLARLVGPCGTRAVIAETLVIERSAGDPVSLPEKGPQSDNRGSHRNGFSSVVHEP